MLDDDGWAMEKTLSRIRKLRSKRKLSLPANFGVDHRRSCSYASRQSDEAAEAERIILNSLINVKYVDSDLANNNNRHKSESGRCTCVRESNIPCRYFSERVKRKQNIIKHEPSSKKCSYERKGDYYSPDKNRFNTLPRHGSLPHTFRKRKTLGKEELKWNIAHLV